MMVHQPSAYALGARQDIACVNLGAARTAWSARGGLGGAKHAVTQPGRRTVHEPTVKRFGMVRWCQGP